MHKITKGLKKKKKGKKSKHKEEELFKPEELEAYRREHQDEAASSTGQNEEWKKFLALTSGVDDILKKTQGDLDRIKSTSFFQRVPPPSERNKEDKLEVKEEATVVEEKKPDIGIVEVSESESEEEEDDDIFDTAYIDAIAAGEVKLAYIPESPSEETTGDDPFDTSIAERAIIGPVVERKGKKLVPIGAAVEVLTGRVQIPTCATARPNRRQILKEKDLLLGSFDDNANAVSSPVEIQKTLLDDDTPIPITEPIDLSKTLHPIIECPTPEVLNEDDEEFAKLAAESLVKSPSIAVIEAIPENTCIETDEQWAAFDTKEEELQTPEDPFDTTFAENILPGKAELKIIENEILNKDSDFDFDPRAEEKLSQIIHKVSINVTDPTGQRESISSLDRVSESDLTLITPIHRDLLGGSNTDLSNLNDKPLKPSEQIDENYIEYCDPFDTSIVETANIPGHTELKFLEKELLGEIKLEEPDDFNPRADEPKERTLSRPDVLNITAKTVSFDLPSPPNQLLNGNDQKIAKPLTPFYVRKSSIPEEFLSEEDNSDPFDTSFVGNNIAPGKAELKQIESELFDPAIDRRLSLSDQDFDPRNERKIKREELKEIIINPTKKIEDPKVDLLAIDHDVGVKVLTPSVDFAEISYSDPFDTSIACNIAPGRTELKLLESELIHSSEDPFDTSFDEYTSPLSAVSNPFLTDFVVPTNDNPFLVQNDNGGSSNPFAFDPTELEPNEPSNNDIIFSDTDLLGDISEEVSRPKPTDLDLKYTNTVANGSLAPTRPPPPRPPPSKETQDLLMSVMGAMDATSSHLLDRIPPTRTPSPVNMRDLHSPSPTPEPTFGDLLDVSGTNGNKTEDLLSMNQDQNENVEPVVEVQKPPRPKPPRPRPPKKPEEPPVKPEEIMEKNPEEIDMFGVSTVPKVATKADILNLYNAPKEEKATDLLFDTVEAEIKVVPELSDFISPEPPSQADLQMDTSDSQSKGSVSSVTFNPFADQTTIKPEEIIEDTSNIDVFIEPEPPKEVPINMFASEFDEFDAFAQKFDNVHKDENTNGAFEISGDAWGNDFGTIQDASSGFGAEESFDAFLALQEPPTVPQSTPNRISKNASQESDEDKDFSVFIKPKGTEEFCGTLPTIAPPPVPVQAAFNDTSPRFNPFDQSEIGETVIQQEPALSFALPSGPELKRTDSQETPPTPLFDEDQSQPLEVFPRIKYDGEGWEMHLRQPNKKKITGQRFWKKIFVKVVHQTDCVLLQLFNQQSDKDPFQELPLQPCYSVSEIGAQQYDQYGKIFTVKLQYIFYKERPGVRPGQVKKAEKITNKLSQFAAYAIQGDYQGVKEFGSDLKKLGLPVEHAPQVSQLMKLGSLSYEDLKQFSAWIEESLFRLQAHRDRALHYKMEEVQITVVDELYVEQDADGHVEKQIARVRLFFLGFLTGMPDIELGVNDMRRQGKEVVGRHDIIPVVTEEWIRLEDVEFHSCIQQDEYHNTHIIKFKPPDACYIELMRFRVRPPKNRELPLQLKATICVTGNRVELRADVLVPGFASRKLGQIPCEDVMIRFPIPECWIYLFRVEKHFRYGSVKSAHRRTGKIKGIERILGTVDTLQESLIEVTSGQAKYEHQHRAIVWRCPRLPKEGQGAYTTHNMVCKLALTSYDQMPESLAKYCYVEFTMPATQVSHTTCRSVSLQNSDSDEPPEKYVRNLSRHEYRVGIEHTEGEGPNAYSAATFTKSTPKVEDKPAPVPEEESSSDSD